MPIRSPRRTYFMFGVTKNINNVPDKIDTAADEDFNDPERLIYAKIKQGIGNYLGLTPLAWNDDVFSGVFGGSGLNQGYTYRRNIGGFKVASYKLHAKDYFEIEEEYFSIKEDKYIIETGNFHTMSIGTPKGVAVDEFINWVMQLDNSENIAFITTPKGHKIDVYIPS